MGILDNFFKKEPNTDELLKNHSAGSFMILGMLVSSSIIFNDEWKDYKKRKGETFELMILSTLQILRKFNEIKHSEYSSFEEDLFKQLFNFARQELIIEKLPCDLDDFVNSRFVIYDSEFSLDYDEQVKLPVHTAYNLFVNPLEMNSSKCEDLFKVMELQIKLNAYYEALNINFNFMLSKKYS